MNERDRLLQATIPRLVDIAGVDPLLITASSAILKYEADSANPTQLSPVSGTIMLYALYDRPGDVSWSIVGAPVPGVSLSSSSGGTVTLTYTNALLADNVTVSASATNNLFSPATLTKQLVLSKQIPAKVIKNIEVFRRSPTPVGAPTGGAYVFSTNTITPPTGWFVTIPVGVDPVYVSKAEVATYNTGSNYSVGITSTWSTPSIIAQNGKDGKDGKDGTNGTNGAPGANGRRGTVDLYVAGNSWSDSVANNAITTATGDPTKYAGDKVTIYNNSGFASTKYWDGISGWVTGQIIDGNLLVSGTVTSDKIGTNELTSVRINTTQYLKAEGGGAAYGGLNNLYSPIYGVNPNSYSFTETRAGTVGYAANGQGVIGYSNFSGQANDPTLGMPVAGVVGVGPVGGAFKAKFNDYYALKAIAYTAAGKGLEVSGKFAWGNGTQFIEWADPISAVPTGERSTKFLRADGTWAAPSAGGSSGVSSFNTRTGDVSLSFTDVYNATNGQTLNANCAQLGGFAASEYVRYVSTTTTVGSLLGYIVIKIGGFQGKLAVYDM